MAAMTCLICACGGGGGGGSETGTAIGPASGNSASSAASVSASSSEGGSSATSSFSSSASSSAASASSAIANYTVSGSATGVDGGTLKLQNKLTNTVTLVKDGSFNFPPAPAGSTYSVGLSQQPEGKHCKISNASGTLNSDVTNITVSCTSMQFSRLATFTANGVDGLYPVPDALAMDSNGNLYGATSSGGRFGWGAVFGLTRNADGSYAPATTLYSFTEKDGYYPYGALAIDNAGNLFGIMVCGGSAGAGTIYKLARNPDGSYTSATTLHEFTTGIAGGVPMGGLIVDAAGNLFGTASYFGANNQGTVFELVRKADGDYLPAITLHAFTGGADGGGPSGPLTIDSAGNLFGISGGGSHGKGVVFKLARKADGSYAPAIAAYSFTGGADGSANPYWGLVIDSTGNLFGAAESGTNKGIVFKLARNADGSYSSTTLHSLSTDGVVNYPLASLLLDSAGNLFGKTDAGSYGHSSIFQFVRNADGSYAPLTTLYSFSSGRPSALVLDSAGNLFGTAVNSDNGTVFMLKN